ncbi:exodeoxyribonuclease V subunit beta [Thalassotalea marina]|uniref:RecBCD enzyme subunit RecB n=1 Tax=Thalassotalea marina TaxID=1673741 RepID=A0A919BJW5_9GAMM|nr:exodeoxyribonuclease V subunit beta [Thalassotalea marina]GHF92571.1 RecBCD enzyme subunit RecB [Thalassotalea marina]
MQDKKAQQLVVQDMPLENIHLIEASAGTGKTFNITRIYLRLLLEKKLTVQQILVMTFTKDATEELKGRIDLAIRDTLVNWSSLTQNDPFFLALSTKISEQDAAVLLKKALLFLDEAAIYTIHGFCKTVLSQHAFSTGMSFQANLEGDQANVNLQAIQDWYRQIALVSLDKAERLMAFYPTPNHFNQTFGQLIGFNGEIELVDEVSIIDKFTQQAASAINQLHLHQAFLFEHLVDTKKGEEKAKRIEEYEQLIDWLVACRDDYQHCQQAMPVAFIDGKRFSRSKVKDEIKAIFTEVSEIKVDKDKLLKNIEQSRVFAFIKQSLPQINELVEKAKQLKNALDFDDLITCLADKLGTDTGKALNQTLRAQYPFALVDEFQDTDPYQYAILKSLYYQQPNVGLMMIGDPKQAIYGFRGGDIFTYLAARAQATYCWNMDTNWRSSASMITSYNRLFYGASLHLDAKPVFGYGIDYQPVNASPKAHNTLDEPALEFIVFPNESSKAVAQTFRSVMANWCANEIAEILADTQRSVRAKDIALLVRDGTEAADVKLALQQAGLSSVYLSDRANLWQSEHANDLLNVLRGIFHVENERLFSAAIANHLFGYTPQEFAALLHDDNQWQALKITFEQLKQVWQQQGFITMALKLMHESFVVSGENQERTLTNLLHLFELLQHASQQKKQPEELLHWFEQQILTESGDNEVELRLESESDLIRIITQHGSKGLEYPYVFIPFATRHKDPIRFGNQTRQLIKYHDEQGIERVSLSGDAKAYQAMADEQYAETIRLLYVAITRAEQKCYLLTTAFDKYHASPLGKTLAWQADEDIEQSLQQLASELPHDIKVTIAQPIATVQQHSSTCNEITPVVSEFNAKIERDWWLSSFTALSRNIRDIGVSLPVRNDDMVNEIDSSIMNQSDIATLSFDLEKGARSGNLLHDILEHTDFEHIDWPTSSEWSLKKYGELPKPYQVEDLYQWLEQIVTCRFKLNDDSFCLAQLSNASCLKEVEFYFPLNKVSTAKISDFLSSHRRDMQQHFQLSRLGSQIALPSFSTLKGMMHGFIDLVFEHNGKYYVCDYKSTHLGGQYQDYLAKELANDIQQHHYDLQYCIYALALHRYLKHALPNYQAHQHFGGVIYLYLRGVSKETADQNGGMYFCPSNLLDVEALDKIFLGEASGADLLGEQV